MGYGWVPTKRPMGDLPAPISLEDCIENDYIHLWGCADAMNQIASTAFQEHGHRVLDTSKVATLRPDAHPCSSVYNPRKRGKKQGEKDCNHFCLPGVPNVMLDGILAEVLANEKRKKRDTLGYT